MFAGVTAVLVVALVAVSVAYVRQRDDLDTARAEVRAAQERIAELEAATGNGSAGTDPRNPLDDLFGGLFSDLLDGLTGGIPGGASASCLTGGLSPSIGGQAPRGDLAAQIRAIADQVEAERGLEFATPVTPVLLDPPAFEDRIRAIVSAGYDDQAAEADRRTLTLLGAIPAGTDLKQDQVERLAGQVAGFYDPATGEVVVKVDGPKSALGALERITLAHELGHALTDQALGLPATERTGDTDGNLARLALVEGDATLLMQRWSFANLSLLDQLGGAFGSLLQGLYPGATAPGSDSPYLQRQLLFPYTEGLGYACRLFDGGGWGAVDAAYRRLPATTAEILFPDRQGIAPADPVAPGVPAGYTVAREDTFGAAQLLWLMEAPGGDTTEALDDARTAAARWAGGRSLLATAGDRSALGLSLVDTTAGGGLCDAVIRWYDASVPDDRRAADGDRVVFRGGERNAVIRCTDRSVRVGIADELDAAAALVR